MMRRAATVAAALLTLLPHAASAQDCKLHALASLRTEEGPQGLPLVPVSIGGRQILMLLDTGATRGVLDTELAKQLGLPQNKITAQQPIYTFAHQPLRSFTTFPAEQFYLANGAKLDFTTVVPSLDLGNAHSANVPFILAGINDQNNSPLKGFLGGDVLRNYDVEIDVSDKVINLFSQDHCEGKVVYWTNAYSDIPFTISPDGQIRLTMTLDGHDVDTVLDTGAANTTLSLRIARLVFGVDTGAPGVERVSGEGDDTVYRTHFKSLSGGGISAANPQILLVRDALADRLRMEALESRHLMPDTVRTPQLILGMDVLSKLHIYIAYKERKLYVTAASPY